MSENAKISIIGVIIVTILASLSGLSGQWAIACTPDQVNPEACAEFNNNLSDQLERAALATASSGNKLNFVIMDFSNEDARLVSWIVGGNNDASEQTFIESTSAIQVEGNNGTGFTIVSYPEPPEDWWFETILNGYAENSKIVYVPLIDPSDGTVKLVQWVTGEENANALDIYQDVKQKSSELGE